MTLHEAVKVALEYAEQGQLTPEVLKEVLGGRPKMAWLSPDEAQVVISYPGWELDLAYKADGRVLAHIMSVQGPFVAVKVAEYPGNLRAAFTRTVYTVLEAMGW